jgi:plastocyanin
MRNTARTALIVAILCSPLCSAVHLARAASAAVTAQQYLVEQKDKEFVYQGAKAATLKIKVGDVIQFKNEDPYFHNVYSLSDVKLFDLGSYPQGQSKSVKFDKPGKVEIECAIHPQMHMVVEVK